MADTETELDAAIKKALDAAKLATEAAEDNESVIKAAKAAQTRAENGQKKIAALAIGAAAGAAVAVGVGALVYLRATEDLQHARETTLEALVQVAARIEALDQTAVGVARGAEAFQAIDARLEAAEATLGTRLDAAIADMNLMQPQIAASARLEIMAAVEEIRALVTPASAMDPETPGEELDPQSISTLTAEIGALMGEIRRLQATLNERPAPVARTAQAPSPAPSQAQSAPRRARASQPPARNPFSYP